MGTKLPMARTLLTTRENDPPSAVAILAERLDHSLRVSVYDGQQNAGRPVGNPPGPVQSA